jgi:hypothetical protein
LGYDAKKLLFWKIFGFLELLQNSGALNNGCSMFNGRDMPQRRGSFFCIFSIFWNYYGTVVLSKAEKLLFGRFLVFDNNADAFFDRVVVTSREAPLLVEISGY